MYSKNIINVKQSYYNAKVIICSAVGVVNAVL